MALINRPTKIQNTALLSPSVILLPLNVRCVWLLLFAASSQQQTVPPRAQRSVPGREKSVKWLNIQGCVITPVDCVGDGGHPGGVSDYPHKRSCTAQRLHHIGAGNAGPEHRSHWCRAPESAVPVCPSHRCRQAGPPGLLQPVWTVTYVSISFSRGGRWRTLASGASSSRISTRWTLLALLAQMDGALRSPPGRRRTPPRHR